MLNIFNGVMIGLYVTQLGWRISDWQFWAHAIGLVTIYGICRVIDWLVSHTKVRY